MTHRKDEGDAAADGLGAVELGGVGEPELLVAGAVPPADDGGAVQQDVDGLAGGQAGGDAALVGGDVDLGLGRQAGGGRQRGRLVWTVDHLSFLFFAIWFSFFFSFYIFRLPFFLCIYLYIYIPFLFLVQRSAVP